MLGMSKLQSLRKDGRLDAWKKTWEKLTFIVTKRQTSNAPKCAPPPQILHSIIVAEASLHTTHSIAAHTSCNTLHTLGYKNSSGVAEPHFYKVCKDALPEGSILGRMDGWVKAMAMLSPMVWWHAWANVEGWGCRRGPWHHGGMGVGQRGSRDRVATGTAWLARQAGRWGARQGHSVAAGAARRCSGPARVRRPNNRGLAQLCHASVSGMELRHLGLVMLGLENYLELENV